MAIYSFPGKKLCVFGLERILLLKFNMKVIKQTKNHIGEQTDLNNLFSQGKSSFMLIIPDKYLSLSVFEAL